MRFDAIAFLLLVLFLLKRTKLRPKRRVSAEVWLEAAAIARLLAKNQLRKIFVRKAFAYNRTDTSNILQVLLNSPQY